MQLKIITEVGVCVRDMDKTTRLLVERFGGQAGEVFDIPLFGMRFRMVKLGNIDFELMEPTSEEGVIGKFIRERGEGIHHVAFAVDNTEDAVEDMKRRGYKPVNEKPFRFEGVKATFLHPKDFSGIMFELVQYTEDFKGWFLSDAENR